MDGVITGKKFKKRLFYFYTFVRIFYYIRSCFNAYKGIINALSRE